MKITRRRFLRAAALIGASAVLAPETSTVFSEAKAGEKQTAQLSKKLYVYNWSYYIAEDTIPEFEKEFSVKVVYDNYSSNEELLAKLQAGATGYDLIFPSGYIIDTMVTAGLLEKLDLTNIPNFKNIEKRFTNLAFDPGNAYSIPYLWGTTGIGFNTEKVSEPVDSWKILWDEKYKGRISMLDDMRGLANPALKLLGYGINTTDPKQIEQAKHLLIKQKPLVKVYTSDTYIEFLKSGDIWLAQGYSGDVFQVMKENKAVKYVIPKEGSDIWIDNVCIPRGAKSKYTSEVFINYLLRPEVAAAISNFTWYANPNEGSHEFIKPEILNNPAIYPPKDVLDKCEFQKDVGDTTEIYEQLFNEVKSA
jgi:spermidine/putrescine transport system substrate-binding protein